jgi:hypothetical protein
MVGPLHRFNLDLEGHRAVNGDLRFVPGEFEDPYRFLSVRINAKLDTGD